MGINTVVWLISFILWMNSGGAVAGGEELSWWEETFWLTPAHPRIHTWITHMFVHAGILHLVGNMIFLFLFGSCVEDVLGRWRYAVFYLLGGLVSALTQIALTAQHFESETPLGGASGAISACMGGFVVFFLKTKINFRWFVWLMLFYVRDGEFTMPAWIVMSWWFLKDLVFALLSYGHEGGGVAFGAHAGGFVAGLLMVLAFKGLNKHGLLHGADEDMSLAEPQEAAGPLVYVLDGEVQSGPFPVSAVREMLETGSIRREALYWCDGMVDWRSVMELEVGR